MNTVDIILNSASSNNTTDVQEVWIRSAQTWAICVAIVGVVGNLMSIATITWQFSLWRKWRRRRSPSRPTSEYDLIQDQRPVIPLDGYTILLLNLSVCDLLYCGINLPITVYTYSYAHKSEEPSKAFCTWAGLFRYLNAIVEWQTLALITIQRCVDLRRSRGLRFFKPKPTIVFVAVIWVVSSIPQMVFLIPSLGGYVFDGDSFKCDIERKFARLIFYCLESALPCLLMPIGCFSIIYQIWSNVRTLRKDGASEELIMHRFRDMLKSVALIIALLLIFLICVIPICVYNIVSLANEEGLFNLGILIYMVYWVQYGVNVFLYIARNENFRKAFKLFVRFFAKKIHENALRLCHQKPPGISRDISLQSIHKKLSLESNDRLHRDLRAELGLSDFHTLDFHLGEGTEQGEDSLRHMSLCTTRSDASNDLSQMSNFTRITDGSCNSCSKG